MTVLARAGALGRRGPISREWELVRARGAGRRLGRADRRRPLQRASSGSSCWPTSRCAAPTSTRSPQGGAGWASGAPTRRPARASRRASCAAPDGLSLEGVKTFCSGAGGLHGALVVARDGEARRVAYVDLARRRRDRPRVVRRRGHARVREPPRALPRRPRARAARRPRRAAARAVVRARRHPHGRELGRHRRCRRAPRRSRRSRRAPSPATTSPPWPSGASTRTRRPSTCGWPRPGGAPTPTPRPSLRTLSVHLREAVARAAQALVDEALRAAGSRPLARGGALDRAARDLRIFLLQHRLDPLLVRAGREAVDR